MALVGVAGWGGPRGAGGERQREGGLSKSEHATETCILLRCPKSNCVTALKACKTHAPYIFFKSNLAWTPDLEGRHDREWASHTIACGDSAGRCMHQQEYAVSFSSHQLVCD